MTELNLPTFGKSPRRKEDDRLIAGRGRYTDDIQLPRQTFACFVRAPHAHARIAAIDVSRASATPGVLAVYTGRDMADDGIGPMIVGWTVHSADGTPQRVSDHHALAVERVRYAGEAVAVVIADSRAAARDAAELVEVDYEELPAVVDVRAAMEPDSPQLHDIAPRNTAFAWELGEKAAVDQAFEKAAHRVAIDLRNNRLIPNAMEPRATIADYDAGADRFTLYLTSQNPHGMRLIFSAIMGLAAEHKLRVVSPDVGGGFGSKAFQYAEETVCLWATRKLKRPVRWTAERSESFLTDRHGRDHITHAELALDADYRFLAMRVDTIANLGGYMSASGSLVPTYMYATLLSGQYDIPAIHARVTGVYTNTTPVDAYRGAGRPEASFVVERLVNRAARQLGVDQAEIRRRNFISRFPHQTPVVMRYDVGDYRASLDKALEMVRYDHFAERRDKARARGRLRGIGLSTYVEACGIGPSQLLAKLGAGGGFWDSAEVRVTPSGKVEVFAGSHSHGQGHETTYAQIVSGFFGVPMDDVTISEGDTDRSQFGTGTYGSRASLPIAAIATACDRIIAKAKKIAGYVLDVPAGDVLFEDGLFQAKNTNKTLSFAELAGAAYAAHHFPTSEIEPGLKEACFFDPPNYTFPAGCHVCEVEIDPETGVLDIVDFVAVDDFGTLVNPMIVEGQIHGGITQGVGQALLEQAVYDPEMGQLLTGSYMDYAMPRADDVPDFRIGFTVTRSTSNPVGMKGCGEAGAIAAPPAVINAICDALDIDDVAMPATSESLWRLARQQSGERHV
ncbi:MAG: xanthine dehydrogenase family protein molybdopterin-binding subunit [Alphaproteobacteria bacterium]|nr:MAG: xanthine dehydrogenase family protein molybdopterin-binding subunit [Alphaproteobacteria bacterium]